MSWDAIVVGLGGMGSAALAHLAARGRRVVGLEQFGPMHGFGSSHGNSRIIRKTYFLDSRYVTLAERAYELWQRLEEETQTRLLTVTGGLMLSLRENNVVDGALRSAQEHGLEHELLDAACMRRRFPAMTFRDEEMGLYEPTAGYLRPEACVQAHLASAISHGAVARFGDAVTEWEAVPSGIRVKTARGESLHADRLIVTAGPWLGRMTEELGLPLVVERQVMHWFLPSSGSEASALESLPIYIVERGDLHAYGFPYIPGEGLKFAFYRSYVPAKADSVNRTVTQEDVAPVRAFLEGLIPSAARKYRASKVCLYTMTPDEHFVIGLHPHHDSVVIAGGFSGHGFKFCSVVGEILADLAINGTTQHAIGLFSPQRFVMQQASKETPVP